MISLPLGQAPTRPSEAMISIKGAPPDRAALLVLRGTTSLQATPAGELQGSAAQRGASMSDADWLRYADSAPMLDYLRGNTTARELRLYAAACCRAIWPMLTDSRSRAAVEAAERSCDGSVAEADLAAIREAAKAAVPSGGPAFRPAEQAATVAAAAALDPDPERAARLACGWRETSNWPWPTKQHRKICERFEPRFLHSGRRNQPPWSIKSSARRSRCRRKNVLRYPESDVGRRRPSPSPRNFL